MFSVTPNVKTTETVTGFTVTFTPEQLLYVVAVIGATVRSGSIPRPAAGLYDALSDSLERAGLIDKGWTVGGEKVNADGVPYASQLFDHLGLDQVIR